MNLKYALRRHIHIYQFILYTRILKPFEDSEPMGVKVDIAMVVLLLLFVLFCLVSLVTILHLVLICQLFETEKKKVGGRGNLKQT